MELNENSALGYSYTLNSSHFSAISSSVRAENKSDAPSHDLLLYIVVVIAAVGPAQLRAYEERVCTGTLIRNDLVITLASCLLTDSYDVPDPDIIRIYERPSKQQLDVIKVFVNPLFISEHVSESKANDFGLIMVAGTKQTEFPKLPQRLDSFGDIKHTCKMGGYGHDEGTSINFGVYDMNKTETQEFRGGSCKWPDRLCLHFQRIMPCKADYGTPIVCGGVLYALYSPSYRFDSLSAKCIDMYITTFVPIFSVNEWLMQVLNAPTANLDWLNNPLYVLLLCIVVFVVMAAIYYALVGILQRFFDPDVGTQTDLHQSGDVELKDEESVYSLVTQRSRLDRSVHFF